MNQDDIRDAFQAYYAYWEDKTPHSSDYLPFDLLEFFKAGVEAAREIVWHDASEDPGHGKTIVEHDVEEGDIAICYGGGKVDYGKWAYAEELFDADTMEIVRAREAEMAAWLESKRQEGAGHK